MAFSNPKEAVQTAIELQKSDFFNIGIRSPTQRLHVKVGVAFGSFFQYASDIFGDAIVLASGLCDLADSDQILVSTDTMKLIEVPHSFRLRSIGLLRIPGHDINVIAQQIEWQNELRTDFFTLPADISSANCLVTQVDSHFVELHYSQSTIIIHRKNLPFLIGRSEVCNLIIDDQRVSRIHTSIREKGGKFFVIDESSYGTRVTFRGALSTVSLRHQGCILNGGGRITLGNAIGFVGRQSIDFELIPISQH